MQHLIKLLAITFLSVFIFSSCNNEKKDLSTEYDQIVEKYVEIWNTGQFEGIHDVLSEDFEIRSSPQFESEKGIDTFKESIINVRKSYPDFHIKVNEKIYSTNSAAARWTVTATGKNGKELNIMGMSIIHFIDGKIKDEWISNNDLSWLQQLGYTIEHPSTDKEG